MCKKTQARRSLALPIVVLALDGLMRVYAAEQPGAASPHATEILGLCDRGGNRIDGASVASGETISGSRVGLNGLLWVVVRVSSDQVDASTETLEIAKDCTGLVRKKKRGAGPSVSLPAEDAKAGPAPSEKSSAAQESGQKSAAVDSASSSSGSPPAQPLSLLDPAQLDASQYVLFIDGREVQGLQDTIYNSAAHRFEFQLTRNADNKSLWKRLLGAPTLHPYRQVTVSLGPKEKDKTAQPTLEGNRGSAVFQLRVYSPLWFWIAIAVLALVVGSVVVTAKSSTTLRDGLLPQLPPREQPYSLGRCQMAFWFLLVFGSFVFLYVLLWDYNTISGQALALMGISSATALAAVAVDVVKDSPADAANRALQALGVHTYADIARIENEIAARTLQVAPKALERDAKQAAATAAKAASNATAANAAATATEKAAAAKVAKDAADLADAAERDLKALQGEISDRQSILRTYDDKVAPFRSESFFKDITTDLNGPTVHRVQVVVWTVALGGVFLVGVYRDLAMPPDFSATLLALMGISGASYVGFKYPEKNS